LPASVASELVASLKNIAVQPWLFGGMLAVGGEALVEYISASRID
jgi:hypothetical protein